MVIGLMKALIEALFDFVHRYHGVLLSCYDKWASIKWKRTGSEREAKANRPMRVIPVESIEISITKVAYDSNVLQLGIPMSNDFLTSV